MVGSTTDIVPAQAYRIYRGAVSAANEISLASDIKRRRTHVINRTNTRAGPIDTAQWALQEIEFIAALTDDLFAAMDADSQISGRSAMTFSLWNIVGEALPTGGGSDVTSNYQAAVVDHEELAPENGEARTRVRLRILGAVL
jgi:hypothetical protein